MKGTDGNMCWQPEFLVDEETFNQMKMGAIPKKCPNCGKELVQIRSLVAHWRMGICERHIASLMARELTGGVQAPGNGCKYACTHPDCSDSPKTWASKTSVQMHYNDVHQSSFEGKIWKCDKCPKTFIAEKLLKIHMTAKHSEGVFPCSLCGAVLKDKHSLKRHEEETCLEGQLKSKKVVCEFCSKTMSKTSYLDHKKAKHWKEIGFDKEGAEKRNVCEVCGKGFISRALLKAHQQYHKDQDDPKNKCPICGKQLPNPRSFRIHMTGVHKHGHKCDICQKIFHDLLYFKRHLLTHEQQHEKSKVDTNV